MPGDRTWRGRAIGLGGGIALVYVPPVLLRLNFGRPLKANAPAEASATENRGGRFFAAVWADVDVIADFYFAGGDFGFGVEAEALAVNDEADVRAHFAVGPEIERFIDD